MDILKLKDNFQIEIFGTEIKELLKVREFELITKPGTITYRDIIKDLETLFRIDSICFDSNILDQLIHESKNKFLANKYGYQKEHNLFFLQKGIWLIDGSPHFNYIGLSKVTYWSDGQVVSSEGPNDNYLLEPWQQGKPEYENLKYSIITLDP